MSAETLRQVFVRAPVGSCTVAVPTILVSLAYETDFEATRALARILAHELDQDGDSAGFVRANSTSDLVAAADVPALLRIYVLALTPREFLASSDRTTRLALAGQSESNMAAFRRLVTRDAPVQDELLKAHVAAALANHWAFMSEVGSGASRGGLLHILDTILSHCRVVPGDNATSQFEFGKDLLVSLTAHGLTSIIHHELGHHTFRILGAGTPANATDVPLDTIMREVADALPAMIESAGRRRGTPVQRDDGRAFKTSSGLTVLCSNEQTDRGSYIHLSLMQDAGPIELERAAQLAYAILDVLAVDKETAVVAYSPRGVFHFAFPGNGPSADQVRNRVRNLAPDEWNDDLPGRSARWLDALARAGRMFKSELNIRAALGMVARPMRFYGLDPRATFEHAMCSQENLQDAPAEHLNHLLRAAVRCADASAVRRLLAVGASPHVPLREIGMSMFAIGDGESTRYFVPTPEDIFDILSALQSAGVNLDAPLDDAGHTLLTEAACGSLDLVRFLLARGCDVNRTGNGGKTPIAVATAFGRYEVFEQLLNAGARPQIADEEGDTPLHAAIMRREERMAAALIEKGANHDAANRQGMTPLMTARSSALVDLLCRAGANIDFAAYGGHTALMLATRRNELDVVRALLERGADVEAATDRGETAMHFAASIYHAKGRFDCLEALLQAGADLNEETNEGETPLMIAAAAGADDAVGLMIRAGADVNAADRSGNSALLKVLQSGKTDIGPVVSLLLQAGASVSRANAAGQTSLTLAAGPGIPDTVRQMIERQAAEGGRDDLGR